MDASGISISLRESDGFRLDDCMKNALFRFWSFTNARWEAMEGCRHQLHWKESRTVRFPLSSRYEAGAGSYSVPLLPLQLEADNNRLRARVAINQEPLRGNVRTRGSAPR
jgi:hypothetical protein